MVDLFDQYDEEDDFYLEDEDEDEFDDWDAPLPLEDDPYEEE